MLAHVKFKQILCSLKQKRISQGQVEIFNMSILFFSPICLQYVPECIIFLPYAICSYCRILSVCVCVCVCVCVIVLIKNLSQRMYILYFYLSSGVSLQVNIPLWFGDIRTIPRLLIQCLWLFIYPLSKTNTLMTDQNLW